MPMLSKPGESRRSRSGVTDTQTLDLDTAVKNGVFGGGFVQESCVKYEKMEMKKMIEEVERTAEVPSVFICPISLQPMQDPVTLCTGQTYDRCNILKWLSIGHCTCPTTMQELWDITFVPNTTLHHLITTWFSQKYFEILKRSADVQGRTINLLTTLKKSKGDVRIRALKELSHLVSSNQTVKKTVIDNGGLSVICSLLGPLTSHAVGSEAVSILVDLPLDSQCKICISQPAVMSLLVDFINEGSSKTKINSARIIEWVMGGGEGGEFDPYIVSSMSLMAGILKLVKDERRKEGAMAGLKLMKMMCRYSDLMASMVRLGGVNVLMEKMKELEGECMEICLFVLERMVVSSPEGGMAVRRRRGAICAVGKMVMKGSERCTGCAVSILRELCRESMEDGVGEVVEAGIATKLLLVLQSGYGSEVKRQCAELLKLCSMKYNDSFFISKCRLTRTIR